jgi:hypothetical protein
MNLWKLVYLLDIDGNLMSGMTVDTKDYNQYKNSGRKAKLTERV